MRLRARGPIIANVLAAIALGALFVHALAWVPALKTLAPSLAPPAVQSLWLLAIAAAMFAVSDLRTRGRRVAGAAALLVVFFVVTVAVPLPFEHRGNNFMGDGEDSAGARAKFEENIPLAGGRPALHFKAHLGDALLAGFDAAYGRNAESPGRAYRALSRTGGLLYALEIGLVLAALRASRRACRFAALALAAPMVVGFFGYYEVGYLAVSAGAFPLLAIGMHLRRSHLVQGAAVLQGFHAALHGFGLLGVAGGVLATLTSAGPWSRRLSGAARFATTAIASYVGWVLFYVLVLKVSVMADSASGNIALRRPATAFYFDRRVVHPLRSFRAAAEIGVASLATGVPLLAAAIVPAVPRATMRMALAYACPGLLFLVAWWPSLGVSRDMDLLFGAFAGIIAAAWLASRRPAYTLAGLAVLVVAHVTLWAGLGDRSLDRIWLGE